MWWCILLVCMLLQYAELVASIQSRRIIIPADSEYMPNSNLVEILTNGNYKLKKLNRDAQIEDVDEDFEPQEFLTAVRRSMFEPLYHRYKRMETRRIMPGWMANWPPAALSGKISPHRPLRSRDKIMNNLSLKNAFDP